MRPSHTRGAAAAVLALVGAAACGGGSAVGGASAGAAPSPAPAPPAASSPAAAPQPTAAAIERARADSMRRPYTAADVQFMQGMIHHHAQAIVMARMAPTHGASPEVRTLAGRIINAQNDEIALMQQWLRERRQEVPEATPGPMKMAMNGMEHEMLMPGMLTPEQMKQLDQARGKEFDRLFVTFMIQHHTGAVDMVKELFASDGAAQDDTVFKLASDVQVDQTTEIARMRKILVAITLGINIP